MLFDKAPCNGSSWSHHRGLKYKALLQYLSHMVRECAHWNKINPVIQVLQEEGFTLLGLATYLLTFHQAEEFLEVYRFHTAQFGGSLAIARYYINCICSSFIQPWDFLVAEFNARSHGNVLKCVVCS